MAEGTESVAELAEPPTVGVRDPESFDPVTFRAYTSAGGRLVWEQYIESSVQYGSLAAECQRLLNTGLLSRVDVVKSCGTELLGGYSPQTPFEEAFGRARIPQDPMIGVMRG